MLRISWGAFVVWSALGACVLSAAPPPVRQPAVQRAAPSATPAPAAQSAQPLLSAEELVELKLDERVTVDYKARPLRACLEDLAAHSGAAIVLGERVAESSLDAHRPVTFSCRSMRVRAVLAHILRPISLQIHVTGEGVTVEAYESTHCGLPARVYGVADLLAHDEADPLASKARRKELIGLLTTTIAPTTWSQASGPAQADLCGDALVVSQFRDAHREIAALLGSLRQEAKLWKEWDGQTSVPALLRGEASLLAAPESPEHPRIRAALAQRGDWEWIETPLFKVLDTIAARCKINCVLDDQQLLDLGIPRDTPVTLNYPNRTAADALRKILSDLDLAYVIRDDAVVVMEIGCNDGMTTRLYPVFDLVADDDRQEAEVRELIRAATSHIGPTTWDTVGGPGFIAPYRGRALVVSHTAEIHGELADLLAGLRRAAPVRKLSPEERAREAARPVRRAYLLATAKDQPMPSAAEIAAVVRKVVAPEVWKDARYLVEPLGGRVLVVAPSRTQRQIAALFAELQILPVSEPVPNARPQPPVGGTPLEALPLGM